MSKLKNLNPLDLLFRDIKKEMELEAQRKDSAKRWSSGEAPVSTYANPENWIAGKIITVKHREAGILGNFQEYFHRLSPSARRLLPAAEGLVPCREELVFGDYWLHPKFSADSRPLEDSPEEIIAITRRFYELMSSWDDFPTLED